MNSDKIASIMDDLSAELPPTLFAVKALVTAPGGTLGHLETRVVTVPFVELPHLLEKGRTAFGSDGRIEVWLAWQPLPEGTHVPDAETTERLNKLAAERLRLLAGAAGTALEGRVADESTETVVARRYSVRVYTDPPAVCSSWDEKASVRRELIGRCDDSDLREGELAYIWLECPEDLNGIVVGSLVNVADRHVSCFDEHAKLMIWANSMLEQFGERPRYSTPTLTRAERASMHIPDDGAAYLQWDVVEVDKAELGRPSAVFDQLVSPQGAAVEVVHAYLRSAADLDSEMIHRMVAQARPECSLAQLAKLEALAKTLIARIASDNDSAHHYEVAADRYVVVSVDGGRRVEGRWVRTDRVSTDLIGDVCSRRSDDDADILAAVWLKNRDDLNVKTLDELANRAYMNAPDGELENAVWRWADEMLVAMGKRPHYLVDNGNPEDEGDKAPEDDGRVDAERFVVKVYYDNDGTAHVDGQWDKRARVSRLSVGEVQGPDLLLKDVDDDIDVDGDGVLAHVWLASRDDLDRDRLDSLVWAAADSDACDDDDEHEALMRWADGMLRAAGEEPRYSCEYDEDDDDEDDDDEDDDESDREEPRVVDVMLPPPQPHVIDVTLPPPQSHVVDVALPPKPQPNYIRW